MSLLTSLKHDCVALTHCKIKGHVISKDVIHDLEKEKDWIETECKRCHYPVFVRVDPENPDYYLVSEDV